MQSTFQVSLILVVTQHKINITMFQRSDVENFLKVNGISIDDSDDVIKSVLISAQWHKDDVDAAILVLRENKISKKTHVSSLHKVFRTDERLRPETISALLGIEMNVTPKDLKEHKQNHQMKLRPFQILQMILISIILSVTFMFGAMWYLKMGIFHVAGL